MTARNFRRLLKAGIRMIDQINVGVTKGLIEIIVERAGHVHRATFKNRSARRASRHASPPDQHKSIRFPWAGSWGDTICGSKAALKTGRYLIIVDSKAGASTSNVARELTGPVLICGLRRRKPQNCGVARLHFHSCSVGAA